jgi:hypothetical protein
MRSGNTIGLAQQAYSSLILTIVPGAPQGSGVVYEDDGKTVEYLTGSSSSTTVTYTRPNPSSLVVTVAPAVGSFTGMPSTRSYSLFLPNSQPLASASYTVGTQTTTLAYARKLAVDAWSYNGQELAVEVQAAPTPVTQPLVFTLQFAAPIDDNFFSGIKGALQKVARIEVKFVCPHR